MPESVPRGRSPPSSIRRGDVVCQQILPTGSSLQDSTCWVRVFLGLRRILACGSFRLHPRLVLRVAALSGLGGIEVERDRLPRIPYPFSQCGAPLSPRRPSPAQTTPSQSPERAATPGPGCRRRAFARRRNPGYGSEFIPSPERTVLGGGSRKAETRIRLQGDLSASGRTKLPDRLALRTEPGWRERPFRTFFLFWRRPRVASILAALVSTPPLGWVKRAAPPGLLGKATARNSSEPINTTDGKITEKKTVPFST